MTKLNEHVQENFLPFLIGGLFGVLWAVGEAHVQDPEPLREAIENAEPLFWVLFVLQGLSMAAMFATFMTVASYPFRVAIECLFKKR